MSDNISKHLELKANRCGFIRAWFYGKDQAELPDQQLLAVGKLRFSFRSGCPCHKPGKCSRSGRGSLGDIVHSHMKYSPAFCTHSSVVPLPESSGKGATFIFLGGAGTPVRRVTFERSVRTLRVIFYLSRLQFETSCCCERFAGTVGSRINSSTKMACFCPSRKGRWSLASIVELVWHTVLRTRQALDEFQSTTSLNTNIFHFRSK